MGDGARVNSSRALDAFMPRHSLNRTSGVPDSVRMADQQDTIRKCCAVCRDEKVGRGFNCSNRIP